MFLFEDEKVNEYLKNADSYKIADRSIKPKDPKDLMVRAFIVNKESLLFFRKKPNDLLKLTNGKTISLEIDSYITSNGKSLPPEKFVNIYKPASQLVKDFLMLRQESLSNVEDILDRVLKKSKNNPNQRPKSNSF